MASNADSMRRNMMMAMTVLPLFGDSLIITAVLLGMWGLIATVAPVGWWLWLSRSLPGDAEAGGGLMVAVIQLCIALGSTLGGVLFDASGYRVTFEASAALLLIAAALTLLTSRRGRFVAH